MGSNQKVKKLNMAVIWGKYGTFGILLLLVIILAVLRPQSILSLKSIKQVLVQSSVNILMAVGEFFAILIAGIDLSVGSIAALSGLICAKLMVMGLNPFYAIVITILLGILQGFINGTLVVSTRLHPFIITLGMQSIYRGIVLIVSNSRSVYGFPASFSRTINNTNFIPVPIIITVVVVLFFMFFTEKTKCGRNIYALGGNEQSAWFSGINITLHKLIVFMISGFCATVSGIVLLARVGAAESNAATGYETFAIAAAIIGGTSFFGGKGKIFGVLMGGLVIGIINYGMDVLTIPATYQTIVMGSLIITSVTIDRLVSQKSK